LKRESDKIVIEQKRKLSFKKKPTQQTDPSLTKFESIYTESSPDASPNERSLKFSNS